MSKAAVDLCILAYNNEEIIGRTLETIAANVLPDTLCRVMVLDNGSTDQTYKVIRTFPFVEPLRVPENRFFSGGANYLFHLCHADHVFFMNSDILVDGGTIPTIVQFAEANPDVGLIGCSTFYPDGLVQNIPRRRLNPVAINVNQGILGVVLRPMHRRFLRWYHYYDVGFPFEEAQEVDVVQDSFIYLRGRLVRNGLRYDEKLRLNYTEDILCMEVKELGYKVMFLPSARVVHLTSATLNQRRSEINEIILEDCIYFCTQYFGKIHGHVLRFNIGVKTYLLSVVKSIAELLQVCRHAGRGVTQFMWPPTRER